MSCPPVPNAMPASGTRLPDPLFHYFQDLAFLYMCPTKNLNIPQTKNPEYISSKSDEVARMPPARKKKIELTIKSTKDPDSPIPAMLVAEKFQSLQNLLYVAGDFLEGNKYRTWW